MSASERFDRDCLIEVIQHTVHREDIGLDGMVTPWDIRTIVNDIISSDWYVTTVKSYVDST